MRKLRTMRPSLTKYTAVLDRFGYSVGYENGYVIVNGEPLDQFLCSKIYCDLCDYGDGFGDKSRLTWVLNMLAGESVRRGIERRIEAFRRQGSPPELRAYETETGNLIVWCDWCMRWHHHSGPDGGPRLSHCGDESSPYYKSKYHLVHAGLLTDEVKKAHKNHKARHCCRCGNSISPVYCGARVCLKCGEFG